MTESKAQRTVFIMGLSPRHKGFYYISALLYRLAEDRSLDVREEYHRHETQAEHNQEDRCMRYAIRYAWDVNEGEIHRLFPNAKLPPSPCEFITALLWELDE